MSCVELLLGVDCYATKVHLSIRSHKGHLVGIGDIDLMGLRHGAYSFVEGPEDEDFQDLLLAVGRAAADVIEANIDKARALQAAVETESSERHRRSEAIRKAEQDD